jgi:hypothetical protein
VGLAADNYPTRRNTTLFHNISVPIFSFDDVLQLSNRKLAIKIDVENYECNVLSGMEQTLRNNRCIIQVETFNYLDQVRSLLAAEAYQLVADFFPNFVFSNTAIRSHWNGSL